MLLTCIECHTTYRVNAHLIGETGRRVRCTSCGRVWMAPPASAQDLAHDHKIPQHDRPQHSSAPGGEAPPGNAQEAREPAPEDLMFIVEEPPPAAPPARPEWDIEDDAAKDEDILGFRDANPPPPATEDIPPGVRPLPSVTMRAAIMQRAPISPDFEAPVMDHRPFGLGAPQFGVMVFLLLSFASLFALFVCKGPVLRSAPSMASLYKMLGFTLRAPGEGFSIAGMTADSHVDSQAEGARTLTVNARLSNISPDKRESPALEVAVKNAAGAVVKSWSFNPEEAKELASGEGVPVTLTLKDAPADARTAEMKIVDR